MKLECVVTCVGYGDFLAASLPANKNLFDYMVVVTTAQDKRTRRVCEYHNVRCVQTDAFTRKGASFRKGAGINDGIWELPHARSGGWVLHMDADIVLPPLARRRIEAARPDPSAVYGCDRLMVPSYDEWARHLACPHLQHEDSTWCHPGPWRTGVRVVREDGYIPIGFFQLWNPLASGVGLYPEEHGTAARGDEVFARRWPAERRRFLPDLYCYHLESEKAPMGANWDGRTTALFGPPPAAEVA